MPIFALARMVVEGHAARPPAHAYLQHPEWKKIWMHMLASSGINPTDEFQALEFIRQLEEEIMARAHAGDDFSVSE